MRNPTQKISRLHRTSCNVFALEAAVDGFEGETHLQTKRATYAEIRAWVRKHYGLHVSNLAISWTKDRCGLAKTRPRKGEGPEGRYASELTPEKEDAIRAAFIRFGITEK